MTETALLVDFFKNVKRQGPGREEDTLRALELIDIRYNQNLKIADIGCGTGEQTLTLARNTEAVITAVDIFPEFLEVLDRNAHKDGHSNKIKTLAASMDALSFPKDSLDIIWSEGAIYNMGFEAGIKKWGEYLKPGGYLSVSEITWTTNSRPRNIEDFWEERYPEIDRASNKIGILENNGFTVNGYFILPQESWVKHYYQPMERAFEDFLLRHHHSRLALQMIDTLREEISMYLRYKAYYSYGFYIGKKI